MTQQPPSQPQPPQTFSRPGAVDLSGLQGTPAAGGAGAPAESSYSLRVTGQNIQQVLEQSMTAPVLLVFHSPTRAPQSTQLARDLATLSGEFEGRFLTGLVDIDASPEIAQALQVPTIPVVFVVVDGRPAPLLQEAVPLEQLRTLLTQVLQQLTTQGITGRHQPRHPVSGGEESDEPVQDPRYAPAQDALERGDIDGAVAEYQRLVDANPADTEAAAGLAMAQVLKRTQGVDLNAARAAAAESPDDVDAQTMVADLDLVGGHVEDAFARLVELVRRTAEDDRDRAREHLLGLFAAVGTADPRVLVARRNLASALF